MQAEGSLFAAIMLVLLPVLGIVWYVYIAPHIPFFADKPKNKQKHSWEKNQDAPKIWQLSEDGEIISLEDRADTAER